MTKIDQIQTLFEQSRHPNNGSDPERTWLVSNATPETAAFINDVTKFNHPELEILSLIARNDGHLKLKELQSQIDISQGLLSRYINRGVKNNILTKEHLPQNKKELSLTLTPLGQEIGELHLRLHDHLETSYQNIINQYSDAELDTVIKFMTDIFNVRKNL